MDGREEMARICHRIRERLPLGCIVRNTCNCGAKRPERSGMRQSGHSRSRSARFRRQTLLALANAKDTSANDKHGSQKQFAEKAMYQAGSTLEEIAEQIPCWIEIRDGVKRASG